MKKITLKSWAKVNLGLNIKRKLPNNYHLVETIYLPIPLFDFISFEEFAGNGEVKISCDAKEVPVDSGNLVFKAAKVFRNYTGIKKGVKISLKKNIPIGSGLGGGSSNAATTLRGLDAFWETNLDSKVLKEMSLKIGSDVASFLTNNVKFESQGGDTAGVFTVLPNLPSCYLLLCFPEIFIGSKQAYSEVSYDLVNLNDLKKLVSAVRAQDLENISSNLYSSFEEWSFIKYPELEEIKNLMKTLGATNSLMSGKGSSVFGIFSREKDAVVASIELSKKYKFVKVLEL